jgi:glycosyltransferase involved in cell wall biosynthesis
MAHLIRVSVVIPFLRGRRGLSPILDTVWACIAQTHPSFEVLIVSNLPDGELEREIASLGDERVRLLCSGTRGVNSARNLGAKASRGSLVLFLDDDCLPRQADYFGRVERLMADNPDFCAIGGAYESKQTDSWRVRGYNGLANAWVQIGVRSGPLMETQNLLGGNICIRRDSFPPEIHFDESILSGGDETEFLRRVRARGFRIGFSREVSVWHRADCSWAGLVTRAWRQGRARRNLGLSTPSLRREQWAALSREFKETPSLLPFALLHFPILYLAHQAPKFS